MHKNVLFALSTMLYVTQVSHLWSMQPNVGNNYTYIHLSPSYPLVSNTVMAVSFAYITSVFKSHLTVQKLGKNIAIAGACGFVYGYAYLNSTTGMSDEMREYINRVIHGASMTTGAFIGAFL